MRKIINMAIMVLCVFVLCGTSFASDIVKNDLKVSKDGAGDYILTSMTQEIRDSDQFESLGRMGLLSAVLTCRENGKWDADFNVLSRRSSGNQLIIEAKKNLRLLMDICDKVTPDERIMALCYYADYNELTIYLHPDQWGDEAIYQEVAKKLNEAIK